MLDVHRIVIPLRILLLLAFAFLLMMELFSVPGDILHDLERSPEAAHLLWPLLVAAEIILVCAQAVIVCTWPLLTMVKKDRIFSGASLRWVDGIMWSSLVGWLVYAVLAVYLAAQIFFTPELRDPGVPVLLFGIGLVATVILLILLVLRALLRQATVLRADMEAVI